VPTSTVMRTKARCRVSYLSRGRSDGDLKEIERVYGKLLPHAGIITDVALVPYDRHMGMFTAALGRHDDAVSILRHLWMLCRKGEFRL